MRGSAKVRVGFIGAGGIARGHFTRTHANPHAEVVALCDVSDKMIEAMVEANPAAAKCAVYKDWREMLDKEKLDGVQIHTPHTLHFEQAMESLDRGLHVLCEKPMVCRVDHAKELIRKGSESGRTFALSYQRHTQPAFRFIKDTIASGKIGEIHYIQGFQSQNWYRGTKGSWRQDLSLSGGGQLNDSGSHLIDIILWTSGLVPAEVFAYVDNLDSEVDILSATSVKFTNGALGTISVIGHASGWWEDLTWFGSEGTLYMRNGELTLQDAKGESSKPAKLPPASDPDTNWIAAIRGEEENVAPPVCGLRVIQLTEAAWLSGDSGKPSAVVFDD